MCNCSPLTTVVHSCNAEIDRSICRGFCWPRRRFYKGGIYRLLTVTMALARRGRRAAYARARCAPFGDTRVSIAGMMVTAEAYLCCLLRDCCGIVVHASACARSLATILFFGGCWARVPGPRFLPWPLLHAGYRVRNVKICACAWRVLQRNGRRLLCGREGG